MKKNLVSAMVMTAGLSLSTLSFAQALATPTSLIEAVHTTVAEVLASGQDDQYVSLKGQVSRQLSSEKYMLTDDTGVIQIEIDEKLSRILPLTPPTNVEVFGEVDKKGNTVELDVDYYSLY